MSYESLAWKLFNNEVNKAPEFEIASIPLGDLESGAALVKTLYASWEGNMSHAIEAKPINICTARREEFVILGNSALVQVEAVNGSEQVQPGDVCLIYGAHKVDDYGHMVTAIGYDGAGSRGFLTTRNIISTEKLVKIPESTDSSLYPQLASFGVKYATAWSNWSKAIAAYRLYVPEPKKSVLNVFGWGGGTSLAGLHLAKILGHRSVMIVGGDAKRREAEDCGIEVIDRREFPELNALLVQEGRITERQYMKAEMKFMNAVKSLIGRDGVDIFFDFIGAPTSLATSRALGRYGVLSTAGWKSGVNVEVNRARSCIDRHTHVHTHYCSKEEMGEALKFALQNGWLPPTYQSFKFEAVDQLHQSFRGGEIDTYFPIVDIADDNSSHEVALDK